MDVIRLRARDLAWHEVEGEIVCLDIARSRYLSVNPAGAALWPLLVEGAPLSVLIKRLVEQFAISQARAESDVAAFLHGLRERELLDT